MHVHVELAANLTGVHLGVVEVLDVPVQAANETLRAYVQQLSQQALQASTQPLWEQQCQEVRQMLRYGKFKASGRSKPAQEYLLRQLHSEGALPSINGPVDLLNAVSASNNLPISLLSVTKCSTNLYVDRGQPGQKFVFNSAGQEIDLTDLITTFDRQVEPPRPVGTPIKDSMAGKIEPTDRHLVAIVYCPQTASARERCRQATMQLHDGMLQFCSAGGCNLITL